VPCRFDLLLLLPNQVKTGGKDKCESGDSSAGNAIFVTLGFLIASYEWITFASRFFGTRFGDFRDGIGEQRTEAYSMGSVALCDNEDRARGGHEGVMLFVVV